EKLTKILEETNAGTLIKQDEISEKLFNKIDEISASFKETLSGFQNSLGYLFEKIEKALLEFLEKQLSVSGEMKNAILSLNDGVSDIQESLKKVNENIEMLSKKQDVVSAVIDKRGEGTEEKLSSLEDVIKKFAETSVEKSDETKTTISELSQSFENNIKPIEKILTESDNNRKQETEKIIEKLSLLPEELNKYLDLNKEMLTQIKTTESNVGNISKTIEDLTQSIFENEKKREEKEIIKEAQNHLSRGVILFYRGSIGAAEKEIRKAIELKNDFAEAFLNLGMVLGETGKTEEAIEKIKKALEIEPGLEEAYNNLGVIQLKGEMYEEAVESFNEAIKLGFKYPILYLNMAKALVSLERIEEAVDSLKKVIEIDPTNAEAKDLLTTYQRGNQ
ncbi:MAG: tetratricopeptide repeat protein, partial [Candidatus Cloacimonadota bacterium]